MNLTYMLYIDQSFKYEYSSNFNFIVSWLILKHVAVFTTLFEWNNSNASSLFCSMPFQAFIQAILSTAVLVSVLFVQFSGSGKWPHGEHRRENRVYVCRSLENAFFLEFSWNFRTQPFEEKLTKKIDTAFLSAFF